MKHDWTVTVLVAIIAILATVLVSSALAPRYAAAQTDSGSADYIVALVGTQKSSRSPLFLIDSKAQSIMVYEYDQSIRRFYLRAVRSFTYDRQLEDRGYHKFGQSNGPSVRNVVEDLRRKN